MRFCSRKSLRFVLPLVAIWMVSGCTENGREPVLSQVEPIDIPAADVGNQQNTNINNPTLDIPVTYPVADGDLLTLVWSDEFNGPNLDPEVWFYATGDGTEKGLPGGWGNNELQYYLPDNAMIVNGVLEITARRETAGGLGFTSARINTEDRFAFQYGRIEASIKMPSGQGLWPAFWMLSQDSDYLCDGEPCVWAAIGEIDIVEAVNLDGTGGNEIFGTIHYGGEFPANQSTETRYTPSVDVTDDFHTYALEWDETEIRWYFDGLLYAVQNSWDSSADGKDFPAPFDQPFHILLNLAVGGNFPGSPDGTTPFPATMEVDWVRVYSGEAPPVEPSDPGIVPEDVIYATDPGEMVDLVATITAFGTTSMFDGAYALDADFNPAFLAQSGNGYGLDNIVQLGFVDLGAGFASGYGSFSFKIKSDDLPNNTIIVKLEQGGAYGDVVLSDTSVSTPLGNGWYQVVLPMSGFTNIDPAVGILFEAVGPQNADGGAPFSFLATDIGFSGTAGGGGGGDGTFVNGDFETGDFAGWTQTPDGGSITLDSSGQGGRAGIVARLVAAGAAPASPQDVLLSQVDLMEINSVSISGSASVTVSVDVFGSLSGAGGVVFIELISRNSAGDETGRSFIGPAPITPTSTWTTYSGTVNVAADVSGGITLQLKSSCGPVDGCGVDASFDNVTMAIN
jgi:beta-glucanase (GH16 family)